jgi:membrane protease YdiL (CAAX protease family)
MSESPPPLEYLEVPEPIATKRLWFGWISLALFLAMLISLSVSTYFGRTSKKDNLSQIEQQFATQVGATKSKAWPAEAPAQTDQDLAELRQKGTSGAAYAAAYMDLSGKPPLESDVAVLKAASSPRLRAIAVILESKKLDRTTLDKLTKPLGPGKLDSYVRLRAREKAGLSADWSEFQKNALGIAVIAVGLAICIIASPFIIAFIFLYKHPDLIRRGHPALPMSLFQSDVFALRAAQLLLAFFGLNVLFELSQPKQLVSGAWSLIGSMVSIAAIVTLVRGEFLGVRTANFQRADAPRTAIPIGIGIYIASVPAIILVGLLGMKLFSGLPTPEHDAATALATSGLWSTVAIVFGAVIVAPIVEEIIFRGLILPALHRFTGKAWIAIVITNLLFASMHSTGIPAWGALAMIGVVCSFAVYQTGSLYPAMVMHGIHNGMLVTLAILSR